MRPELAVSVLAAAAAVLAVPWPAGLGGRARASTRHRLRLPAVAALGGAAAWRLLDGPATVLVGAAIAVLLAGLRMLRRRRDRMAAEGRAAQVLGACDGLAADLAAGQPPQAALTRAAEHWPELAGVAAAGRMGASVPAALRELARRPGAGELRVVAAAWQVAEDRGAGLADTLRTIAGGIGDRRRTTRLVSAELASARATARLLAVLPVGVLLLGAGLGGDPLGFLLGTMAGVCCLAAGLGLAWAGMEWLERIADGVLGR